MGRGWEIKHKSLSFVPCGQNEKGSNGEYLDPNGSEIDQLQEDIAVAHSPSNYLNFNLITKPRIYIPFGCDEVNKSIIFGYCKGDYGSLATFDNFHFIIQGDCKKITIIILHTINSGHFFNPGLVFILKIVNLLI